MSPAGAAVLASLVLWLAHKSEPCLETAWSGGYLDPAAAIQTVTLAAASGAAGCACCALCHQNRACASFSFRPDAQSCLLHDVVASYATLTSDPAWSYFVMPGRSGHHQFCRRDSDCLERGEMCRGRVCTAEPAVTCRVIYGALGAGERYGPHPVMHGWLGGRPLALQCMMAPAYPGFTRLFRNVAGTPFNASTVGRHDAGLSGGGAHSVLELAEDFRRLGAGNTYRMLLRGDGLTVRYLDVPRHELVLAEGPRATGPGRISEQTADPELPGPLSLPFRPQNDTWLPLRNDTWLIGVRAGVKGEEFRSLAGTGGRFWRDAIKQLELWILE